MQKITPFLWFDRNAEEAMNFYVSVFSAKGGSASGGKNSKIIDIKRYPEGPLEPPMEGMEGQVLTGIFELDGQRFMALDGGPIFKPNESVSFLVECKDQKEIDYYWNKFTSDGGQESQCGWCKDKYGFSWQIVPDMNRFMDDSDKARSDRAMKALLQMKKIDIKKLEEAYKG